MCLLRAICRPSIGRNEEKKSGRKIQQTQHKRKLNHSIFSNKNKQYICSVMDYETECISKALTHPYAFANVQTRA